LPDDRANPETIYLRNLFQETLKEALDELPGEQKQAFVLNNGNLKSPVIIYVVSHRIY